MPRIPPRLAAAILIAFAVLRMATTLRVFAATTDEASHVGGGLEILQDHRYALQPMNPPLPRVFMALPLYLSGVRLQHSPDFFAVTHSVFYNQNRYEKNLMLARIANLLFFALAAVALWMWSRRELGENEALAAVLLFTMQPIAIGYSALANHDAAALASMALALLAFSAWLKQPGWRRAAVVGAAYGFAILCKFSCVPYVPLAAAAVFAVRIAIDGQSRRALLRAMPAMAGVVLASCALVVWAGYAFSLGTIGDLGALRGSSGPFGALARLDASLPLPAPRFFLGLGGLVDLDREGMLSYLFGKWSATGFRWYFPAALALKATLASIALWLTGFALLRWMKPAHRRVFLECVAAAAAILVFASHSRLDLGVRYVLPVFVPLSLAAGVVAVAMLRSGARSLRIAAVALLVAHAGVSFAAHPDYFPYFNALAGRDPSRYLVDSNLDWEQDALRLRRVLREVKADRVWIRTITTHDYAALGFPPVESLDPNTPPGGWAAVGYHFYRLEYGDGRWWWLKNRPYRAVGKGLRLYHIDAAGGGRASSPVLSRQ